MDPDRRVAALSLRLLRGFELRRDGVAVGVPHSSQRVIAYLGLNPGRQSRIVVAGNLWIDFHEERAAAALRTALWRLGGTARGLVTCERQSLSLGSGVAVDLYDALGVARAVLDARPADVPRGAMPRLRDSGDLLPGWYDDWVVVERERFRQLRLHALEQLCVQLSAAGRHAEATDAGLEAVATEPLRESAHRALIAAHVAAGNLADATRQYTICTRLLRRALNVGPSSALTAMAASLVDHF